MCIWIFHAFFFLTFIEEIMFRTSIERFCHVFERSNSLFISNDVIFLREISSIIRPFMAYFLRKNFFEESERFHKVQDLKLHLKSLGWKKSLGGLRRNQKCTKFGHFFNSSQRSTIFIFLKKTKNLFILFI